MIRPGRGLSIPGPAYARAVRVALGTTAATVVALDDLVAMQRAVDRPQDRTDAEALEAIRAGDTRAPP